MGQINDIDFFFFPFKKAKQINVVNFSDSVLPTSPRLLTEPPYSYSEKFAFLEMDASDPSPWKKLDPAKLRRDAEAKGSNVLIPERFAA